MILQRPAFAGPVGGTVVDGAAAISQSGNITNINQSSNRAIINWQDFSVGARETVNFNQPSASSATLNRVIGNEQSIIAGALNANGRVFLVNSAGILFAKGAQVNVGGLVASTLDISNKDFMAGNYVFSGTSQASVINQGRIRAGAGGFVSLLGKTVSNEGVISARLGTVMMASGEKITLNFGGDSLLDVTIDRGTLNGLVANKRAIRANGGTVILTAKAADQLLSAQVNNSGVIQARSVAALKGGSGGTVKVGKIKLLAQGGTAKVAGTLDASAPKGGDGGFIETSGDKVQVADSAVITTQAANGKTGTWLVDPTNFVIAASGGDITGATLSNQLNANNVTLTSAMATTPTTDSTYDHIFVNDAVTWSANTTLTLNADNNIYVNAPITGTGAASGLTLIAFIDINVNATSALNAATITATAGTPTTVTNIKINAPQVWTTAHSWDFIGNLNINAPISWTGSAPLTITGTNMINVNAIMTGTDANSKLSFAAPDINFNIVNAFNVRTLTATASNNVNIGYAQTLSPASSWTLTATNAVNVNSPVTGDANSGLVLNAGTNINVNAPSALNVIALSATAVGDININEAQVWTTAHPWVFTGNLNVNAPVNWAGTTPLTLTATNAINVNAMMGGFGLVLNAGTDITVAGVNAFNVTTLAAIAGNNVNIAGAQTWTTAGQWKFAGSTVNVNGPLNWSAGTLTLNAAKNVFVNAPLNATGAASFAANYGRILDANGNPTATVTPGDDVGHTLGINADTTPMALYMGLSNSGTYTGRIDFSGTGNVTLGGQTYSVINSVAGLDAVASNLSGNYVLGSNLSNLGFADLPSSSLFNGNFNGLGHALSLASASTIGSPLSVALLKNTNVVLNSTGDININAAVVSGAGLLTFNAGNKVNLYASVSGVSSNTGSFAFVAPNMIIGQSLSVTGANIFVNAPVTWSSDATLTLAANRDININRDITATGTNAGLVMNYGGNYNIPTPATYSGTVVDANGWPVANQAPAGMQYASITLSGPNSGLNINGSNYQLIRSMSELDLLDGQNSVDGSGTAITANNNFALAQDLDASGTTYTRALISNLGGTFTGLGHKISNLTINSPPSPTTTYIGLIGQTALNTTIRDIGLVNASVTGRNYVGTLLGRGVNSTTISNVYATGSVTATGLNGTNPNPVTGLGSNAGGLIAQLQGGSVTTTYTNVTVTGFGITGGLIGSAGSIGNVTVTNTHAIGNVTGNDSSVGGLIGSGSRTTISNSYATGNVAGGGNYHGGFIGRLGNGSSVVRSFATGNVVTPGASQYVGGLTGENDGGLISYTYATGNVSGQSFVGGLIGWNTSNSLDRTSKGVNHAYATGNVTGDTLVGGFVGTNGAGSPITNSYAKGSVTSTGGTYGGFTGNNYGFISYSYATGSVGVLGGPMHVGGFAGANGQTGTIEHSYSTGNVSGSSIVGGVVGTNSGLISHSWSLSDVAGTDTNTNGALGGIGGVAGVSTGTIVDSYFNGRIISGTGAVGGVVGWAPIGNVVNSYYNIEKNPGLPMIGTPAPGIRDQPTFTGGGGLTTEPFKDIELYLNHTIDQVLAERAADAAAQAAAQARAAAVAAQAKAQAEAAATASQTAGVIGASAVQTTSAAPPGKSVSSAGRRAATNTAAQDVNDITGSIEQQVKADDRRVRERAQKAAARAAERQPGFGATIRSIEVDGKRFELKDDKTQPDVPPDATPAPPAGRQ